jgi:hypothetical protein
MHCCYYCRACQFIDALETLIIKTERKQKTLKDFGELFVRETVRVYL